MAPTVAIGDILLVTSHHDDPFTIMFDSRRYRLEPGKETPVPFEAVMLWWGDPRATGTVQSLMDEKGIRSFVADRETEVRRLRTKWGIIGGDETQFVGTNGAVVPPVVVTDLDGERIYTVADDPSGDAAAPVVSPTIVPNADLMAIIQRQQAQIDKLAELVSAGSANEATSVPAPETPGVPVDEQGQQVSPPAPPEPPDTNAPPADTEGQQVPPPPPAPTNDQGTPFSELT